MQSKNYDEMFKNFYDHGKMDSTYKGVFLYALTDVGHYGEKDLIGDEFLQQEDDKIKMQLDFIAIRFVRYYWEIADSGIRHMPERMADVNPDLDYINIIKIIKNETKNYDKIPDLQELASPNMEMFRKNVIVKTMRNEVVPNILNDLEGLYERNRGQNSITFNVALVDFLKNNMNHIRKHIEIKIQKHLKNLNPDINSISSHISNPSPFFRYIGNYNHSGIYSVSDIISDHDTSSSDHMNVILEKKESIVRKGQNKFRDMVLKNYHYKCAICGITEENLLEASHIIPVKYENTSGSKTNGICLCVLHHKMFDVGYICFDSDYNLHLSNNIKSEIIKNSCIIHKIMPDSCNTLPSKPGLKEHCEHFGFKIN